MDLKIAMSSLKRFSERPTNMVLGFLLTLDMLFILLNAFSVVAGLDKPDYSMLYVDSDRGFAERFQYVKFGLLILACAFLIIKKRFGYVFWGFLFSAMLLDDAFEFHETIGEWIAVRFDLKPWFGLRSVDWGELCYAAGFGLTLVLVLSFFYKTGPQRFKDNCKDVGLLLLLFAGFAVGVDMLHSLTLENPPLSKIMALLEDGGEMLAISLVVWYFAFIIRIGNREQEFLNKIFKDGYKNFQENCF